MRYFRVLALTLSVLLGGATAGAEQDGNPDLDIAERRLGELRFAEAQKALDAAWRWPGNSAEQVRRILELQGICAGTLGQGEKARIAFRRLLSLDPRHRLPDGQPPRVTTPFYEAKGWIADRGGLSFNPAPPLVVAGQISSVVAALAADPLGLARKVRFHVRADGGPWQTSVSELADGRATAPVSGALVEWWAELLGEYDMGLAQFGTAVAPVVNGERRAKAPEQVAVVKEALPPVAPPVVTPAAKPEVRGRGLMPVAYALLGAGALGAGAGGWFAYDSYSARARVDGAPVDGSGLTTGLTQREAFALDAQARQSAAVGNALLGAAAACVASGVALWFFDGSVAVTPGPNGATVSGVLP